MGNLFGFEGVTAKEIADLVLMTREVYDTVPGALELGNTVKWENINLPASSIFLRITWGREMPAINRFKLPISILAPLKSN